MGEYKTTTKNSCWLFFIFQVTSTLSLSFRVTVTVPAADPSNQLPVRLEPVGPAGETLKWKATSERELAGTPSNTHRREPSPSGSISASHTFTGYELFLSLAMFAFTYLHRPANCDTTGSVPLFRLTTWFPVCALSAGFCWPAASCVGICFSGSAPQFRPAHLFPFWAT